MLSNLDGAIYLFLNLFQILLIRNYCCSYQNYCCSYQNYCCSYQKRSEKGNELCIENVYDEKSIKI
jgi:hypothetical protein